MSQDTDPIREESAGREPSRAEGRRMACEAVLASRAIGAGRAGDAVLDRLKAEDASSRAPTPNRPCALRSRPRSWIVGGALAAAIIVAVLVVLASKPDDGGDTAGRIVERQGVGLDAVDSRVGSVISGTLEVRPGHADGFVEAVVGRHLAAGDVLRAGGDLPSEVALSNAVKVILDTGSEVVLAPDPSRPYDLRLERGQLFAVVTKGTPFRVLTCEGNVKSLGTMFAVSLGEHGGLAVTVEEGVVEVDSGGQLDEVKAGHHLLRCPGSRARIEGGESCRRGLGWVERFRRRHRGGRADRESGEHPDLGDDASRRGRGKGRRERNRERSHHVEKGF